MYTPIVITEDNIHWALTANLRLVYSELAEKFPVAGKVVLAGDLDFDDSFTVKGVTPAGPRTALSLQSYIAPLV